MATIRLHRPEDIPEDQLEYYQVVSKEDLIKAGIGIPNLRGEKFYLDSENYKIFMNALSAAQREYSEKQVDTRTKFINGSQEYGDYYYPKIDNTGRRR